MNEKNRMNESFSISIIGAGALGVSFAYNFLKLLTNEKRFKNLELKFRIYLFGDTPTFGVGYPYQNDYNTNLVNREPSGMSISIYDKLDFENWLISRNKFATAVSRNVYGEYLRDTLIKTERSYKENRNIEFIKIKDKVQEILPFGEEGKFWKIKTLNKSIITNYAIISSGIRLNNPYPNLKDERNYIIKPLPNIHALINIESTACVGIIGTRLTGIECALSLLEQKHKGEINMISRNGHLPLVRAELQDPESKEKAGNWLNEYFVKNGYEFDHFLRRFTYFLSEEFKKSYYEYRKIIQVKDPRQRFVKSIEYSKENINPIQECMYALNLHMEYIWNDLSDIKKRSFLKDRYSSFLGNRVTIPIDTAIRLERQLGRRISLFAGVTKIMKKENKFIVKLLSNNESHHYDWLVNCTGIQGGVIEHNGFLKRLISDKIIALDEWDTLQVNFHTNELKSINSYHKNLFSLGQPTFGTFFFTNVLELNIIHVKRVIERIKIDILSSTHLTR